METNNQTPRKSAGKRALATQCAWQRDRWSRDLVRQREDRHQAEVALLRRQLDQVASERAGDRRRTTRTDTLQRQIVRLTSERDVARQRAARTDALERQVVELSAARDAAGERVRQLEASLATATRRLDRARQDSGSGVPEQGRPSSRSLNHLATAAGVVLSVGVAATALTLQNAQSTVQTAAQPAASDMGDAGATEPATVRTLPVSGKARRAGASSEHTRIPIGGFRRAGHRQWGPPIFPMQRARAGAGGKAPQFDALLKKLQVNLRTLGFQIGKADGLDGPRTEQALNEFEALYLSGANLQKPPSRAALQAITANYADLARDDAGSFNVDRGVLAAIRLGSVRTGVDFSYLLKLAAVESNFDPVSEAAGSSATGLYQFTRETWLNVVKAHGARYGLQSYVSKIDYYTDKAGNRHPVVHDKALYRRLLALRKNPRLSAMMAAESVKDNARRLTRSFDRTPTQADLYLTHFLGTDGAISFLKAVNNNPDALAVDMFPAAAQSNQDIFHPKTCRPRTVDEVYELFGQKFSSLSYSLATN